MGCLRPLLLLRRGCGATIIPGRRIQRTFFRSSLPNKVLHDHKTTTTGTVQDFHTVARLVRGMSHHHAEIMPKHKGPRTSPRNKECRYGSHCRTVECHFQHPLTTTTTSTTPSPQRRQLHTPSSDRILSPRRQLPCRYGSKCRTIAQGCHFQHRSSKDGVSLDSYHGPLDTPEANGYRAAGILLLQCRPVSCYEATAGSATAAETSHVQVLCCAEIRTKRKNDTLGPLQLSLLGGKIEDSDAMDSRQTAAREFWEETGGLVPLAACQRLVGLDQDSSQKESTVELLPVWCGHAKYVLYVAFEKEPQQQQPQWDDLPFRHAEALRSGQPLPQGAEASHLVWVDWKLIKDCMQQQKHNNHKNQDSISFFVPSKNGAPPERLVVPFSVHAKFTFANPNVQEGIESIIQKLLQRNVSTKETPSTVPGDETDTAVQGMNNLQV